MDRSVSNYTRNWDTGKFLVPITEASPLAEQTAESWQEQLSYRRSKEGCHLSSHSESPLLFQASPIIASKGHADGKMENNGLFSPLGLSTMEGETFTYNVWHILTRKKVFSNRDARKGKWFWFWLCFGILTLIYR